MAKPQSKSGVAARYAEAAFDLAHEANALDAVESDFKAIEAAIDASPALRTLLKSPIYDADEKGRAMAAIGEKLGVGALARNFLGVLANNRRLFALDGVLAAFFERLSAHRGEVAAEAISAAPLTDEQTRRLRGEIERHVGKAVNLTARVDADLLGGMVVKIGSTMVDSSLRAKLNRLKTTLKEA